MVLMVVVGISGIDYAVGYLKKGRMALQVYVMVLLMVMGIEDFGHRLCCVVTMHFKFMLWC